jgi:hypothetical protein
VKFNLGDLVWIRSLGPPEDDPAAGEYPGCIIGPAELWQIKPGFTGYRCEVPFDTKVWIVAGQRLRPRRDDYQQHEPRMTWEDIKILATTPGLVEEPR